MDDERWTATKNRVVLVLTTCRVTLSAALLQTDHFFKAEVPATRSLTKIAADRPKISDLRSGNGVRCFRETGNLFLDGLMFFDFAECYQRTHRQSLGVE